MATETVSQVSSAEVFPTPSTTPRRGPSMHSRGDSSPGLSSSSPPSPISQSFFHDGRRDFQDVTYENTLSPLDPRRFTPTLHASLVSEILSLRRDVESKTKAIDVLERTLDESRIEAEDLSERLSQSTKETRSLKHQLQLVEGGTSSALTELARERDEALENVSDVRKKLDQAQKKARSREDEIDNTLELWNRDKESWDGERRNLERKIHVVEGRLKVVLTEVAAVQAAGNFHQIQNPDGVGVAKDEAMGKDSDTASAHSSSQGRRRTSVTSISTEGSDLHDPRYSVASVLNMPGAKRDGISLAQELAFDEEDDFDLPGDGFTPYSPEALPEERPMSVHSQLSHTMEMGAKARKILGLSLHSVEGYGLKSEPGSPWKPPQTATTTASYCYQDVGIQYSPPPSPKLQAETETVANEKDAEGHDDSILYQTKDSSTWMAPVSMVSTSCQTVGDLPTPPWTPKLGESPSPSKTSDEVAMVSVSVQTEQPIAPETHEKDADLPHISPSSSSTEVPMIAIHPPCSEPSSPRGSVVLPPQTKSASCQTDSKPVVDSRTVGIQTEEIRIDQRPVKLPASLLPSAIPDLPLRTNLEDPPIQPYHAPPPRTRKEKIPLPPPIPAKAPSRSKPHEHVQAYPGNNDNGPLSDDPKTDLRRPLRSSSLFAGFDQQSDEEATPGMKDIFTDDELLNRPFASYTLRRGKLVSTQGCPSLDETTEIDEHILDAEAHLNDATADLEMKNPNRASRINSRTGTVPLGTHQQQQDIRRAVIISNGAAAHQRIRSPSEPSLDGSASGGSSIAPPFPVPIRLSSRKFPVKGSNGQQSPTPSNPRNVSDPRRPSITRQPTLRRVRSAAAMSQTEPDQPLTRSSPAMSISSYAADSPQYPSLPFNNITTPRRTRRTSQGRSNTSGHSTSVFSHQRDDSTATSVQPTSVVDAIAQTMVGEWMFKYVRRRRSFGGVGEAKDNWEGRNAEEVSANIANSGSRHKRWVWLAPYERAVMWSSKQPTSGPALLGKSGRKLTIQSVLDVKDDNPLPKGFDPQNQFNRSILILTPERALKFTATTIERHYVWLTALSFLSHSSMGIHDLAALPPIPQEEFASSAPTATLRRNPIRDSIKIAKGRPRPRPRGKRAFKHPEPVPELPAEVDMVDAADPPTVPRFSNHSRKRSNTTPRIPMIRSFSNQGTVPLMPPTQGPFEAYAPPVTNSGQSTVSGRTSEASVRTGNYFDAIGTVRMEAFIDQTGSNQYHSTHPRHARKPSSPWSSGSQRFYDLDQPRHDYSGSFRNDDPFGGF
ncbi:meiotic cell cortex C-terminal pleckstrin homology-domain-containing protein [Aspergillus bertholletiae]|uniref:Meiotic cell cortex C-terminal pleckstrin homology-domain-containing protein n=1 Tax=Aspergillus bertholletiae TaxID=1226010 RepID=A0A5N7BCL9_9EURO|nr:meiotic cell cortex C-terminal pleckstrin homology-domain-containing protein [Aspergillus bertholletiae]